MTTQPPFQPSEWSALADAPEEVRRSTMRKWYTQLPALPDEERVARMTEMAKAEYQLPDDKLRTFTKSRLLVWLDMNREEGKAIAATYDGAVRRLPAAAAMKRVAVVQSVCRDFTDEQMDGLYELIPSVIAGMPRKVATVATGARVAATAKEREARKPWWRFW